jgi:hypothetical protein
MPFMDNVDDKLALQPLEDPDIRVLANGTRVDRKTGKFISGPTNPPFTDPHFIAQVQAERRQIAEDMTVAGVIDGLQTERPGLLLPDSTEPDVIRAVTGVLAAEILLRQTAPEGTRLRAWEAIKSQAGIQQSAQQQAQQQPAISYHLHIDGATLAAMAENRALSHDDG